jgi:hypothetical protein
MGLQKEEPMGSARRRAIVVALGGMYAVLLLFGQRLLGDGAGVAILVASFLVGFAWLLLLVAPWAARGRTRPGRTRPGRTRPGRERPGRERPGRARGRERPGRRPPLRP